MKQYLIKYDTNLAEKKDQLALVYAEDFKSALKKLNKTINVSNEYGTTFVTNFTNLTIE